MRLTHLSSPATRVLIVSLMISAVAMMAPSQGAAGDFPKLVYGYVWDQAGTPLVGAEVTVNMLRPDDSVRSTETDTTLSEGDYMVSFDPATWMIGDRVQVISSYMGNTDDNKTDPILAEGPQWVNITYDYVIPEFGSAVGLLFTGALIGLVAVVALVYFKKR